MHRITGNGYQIRSLIGEGELVINTPNLVKDGLSKGFETGYNSEAINMMYNHTKKSPDEISALVKETWYYINHDNKSNHVVSHFLYMLKCEVKRAWVKDISFDIVKYGLECKDTEIVDMAIGLIETWDDKDLIDLLYNTELKVEWLQQYKIEVLKQFDYFK